MPTVQPTVRDIGRSLSAEQRAQGEAALTEFRGQRGYKKGGAVKAAPVKKKAGGVVAKPKAAPVKAKAKSMPAFKKGGVVKKGKK